MVASFEVEVSNKDRSKIYAFIGELNLSTVVTYNFVNRKTVISDTRPGVVVQYNLALILSVINYAQDYLSCII